MAAKYKGPRIADLKGSALHRRVMQLAAHGDTRHAIPTKLLPQEYVKARQAAIFGKQPVVPGDTMTNADLAREANAATAVQYGPQERQLAQQDQSLQLQGRNTGDYYNTYINALKGAQDHATAISGAVSQRLQDIGTSGQQAATSADTSTIQRMQADAQQRGASVDPKLAAQASQAAQTNRSLSDAQAGTASLIGQTNANYLGALQAAAGQGRLQALGANQLAQSQLGQSKQALAAEKGQANLAYRGKRRSEEATNVATSALAGVNAASKVASTKIATYNAQTARQRARTAAQTAASSSTTARERLSETERHNRAVENKKPKGARGAKPGKPSVGPGSLPPAQETKFASQANQVASILQNPPKTQDGKPATRAQVLADIRAGSSPLGKGIDPRVINVGMSLADNKGALGPWGQHNAHNLGLHVNKRWKTVKGKAKRKAGPAAGPAGPVG